MVGVLEEVEEDASSVEVDRCMVQVGVESEGLFSYIATEKRSGDRHQSCCSLI